MGTIDRSLGQKSVALPVSNVEYPILDILVEGMGRVNFGANMLDRKGITSYVSLNGMTLMNWEVFNLNMSSDYVANLKQGETVRPGMFFKTDLVLDNVGPQFRLFCPGVWLKKGANEVVVFDMHQLEPGTIEGIDRLEE